MSSLKSAGHLADLFKPDVLTESLQRAVNTLRPHAPEVIVVTGLSGILFGTRLADQLGCKLAVVRRKNEMNEKHGGGYPVEGWRGGKWVFVDDLVSTGETMKHAIGSYSSACTFDGIPAEYLGTYLHQWSESGLKQDYGRNYVSS